MAILTYQPGCAVSLAGRAAGGDPVRLPKVLHADTTISLAPSVGTCNLTVADPDGQWAATIKPNDGIVVAFTSRASGRGALGQLSPGPASAWSGLVDSAVPAYDPRTQYGRAVKIAASTMWKPLVVTAVPLQFFFSGTYPAPGVGLLSLLSQAIFSCEQNLGLTMATDFGALALPIVTSVTNFPTDADINDPRAQNWAAYLMSMLTAAGVECYAREDGTFVVRDFRALQNPARAGLLSLPTGELFASSGGGVSDRNLVTNAVVTWGPNGSALAAAVAPDNGLQAVGPLPPQLTGTDGKPLAQVGKRFVSYTADFLNSVADAKAYAGNIRAVGMAGIDTFQGSVALNGDLRIGAHVLVPCYDRRYYVTTVGHYFEDQVDAETTVSGNYGVPTGYVWNEAAIGGASNYLLGALLGPDGTATSSPTTTGAGLPPPADAADPDVRWLPGQPVIDAAYIASVLGNAGSPLQPLATQIWSQAQKAGINPAFALAVWQEETGSGNAGVGRPVGAGGDYNPGSVTAGPGGFVRYLDYASAVGAWFPLLAGPLYVGGGNVTVSRVAAVYDPATAADPAAAETWATNVAQIMDALIAGARIPAVAASGTQPAPGATGSAGAMAAYAPTLARAIPTKKYGAVRLNNVIVPGTALGDYAARRPGGFGVVECTTFVEYLMEAVGGVAGIVGADGTIAAGPNASAWGGYLAALGFHEFTGSAPLPGHILLYRPGETDPATGLLVDHSAGFGHVGVVAAVRQPDGRGRGGSVTIAAANVPDPVDDWRLTQQDGLYAVGGLASGAFFGSTPFSWWGL